MEEFQLSKTISDFVDIPDSVFKTPSNVNTNATRVSVYINPYGLIFTSERAHNNWLYYAGLEYVGRPTFTSTKGQFLVYYESGHSDRIDEILERCQPC